MLKNAKKMLELGRKCSQLKPKTERILNYEVWNEILSYLYKNIYGD